MTITTNEIICKEISIDEKISIDENKIDEVVQKMIEKFDMSEDKAKMILGIGILNGFMMNKYRTNDEQLQNK